MGEGVVTTDGFDMDTRIEPQTGTQAEEQEDRGTALKALQLASINMLRRTVEAMARRRPRAGAVHVDLEDGCLGFGGADLPLSRAVGIATSRPVTGEEVAAIESFYASRGSTTRFTISPRTDHSLVEILEACGYRKGIETKNWFVPLEESMIVAPDPEIEVVEVSPDEEDLWARHVGAGFAEQNAPADITDIPARTLDMFYCLGFAEGATPLLARRGGEIVGGAVLHVYGGIASLRTCSTRIASRNNGVQSALIAARLRIAIERGCSIAFSSTEANAASARNLCRFGFAPLSYTHVMWKN
jgi:hypothetical protein